MLPAFAGVVSYKRRIAAFTKKRASRRQASTCEQPPKAFQVRSAPDHSDTTTKKEQERWQFSSVERRTGTTFFGKGRHIQCSTSQGNPRIARQIEAAHKTRLAKGEAGIEERTPAPTLKEFAERFKQAVAIRCAEKPATVKFYEEKLKRLLEYPPLAKAKLDSIDESLIERYVQTRRNKTIGRKGAERNLSPASVNRELATLRRLLYLAKEWK